MLFRQQLLSSATTFNFRICVPTYRRQNPLCLQLLDYDEDVELHFYVRKSEYDTGMYSSIEFVFKDQAVFHMLSDDTKDIGDTRQQILQSCIDDKVDYCVMLDDSVCEIYDARNRSKSIENCIEQAIYLMQTDDYAKYVADFAFVKAYSIKDDRRYRLDRSYATDFYFTTFPCQCHIIDVNKVKEAGIRYYSLEEHGFEDANFLGDIIKAGLLVIGRQSLVFTAEYANVLKTGGNHVGQDIKALQDRYDKYNKMTLDYLKLDGTSIEKRYRSYVGDVLSLIKWDYDFYREVLVYKRKENKDVIANHLSTYN